MMQYFIRSIKNQFSFYESKESAADWKTLVNSEYNIFAQ